MSESAKLLRFAVEGGRVRRAAAALEQASPQIMSALRRAMPFLVRHGAQVALCFARAIPVGELLAELPRPIHAVHLTMTPGGAHGAIVLDAGAIAMILDGVLGGDGSSPPALDGSGLTPPQVALVSRVLDGVVRSFSEVFARRFGVSLQATAPDGDAASSEAAPVACSFEIGAGSNLGRVVLLVAKEALLGAAEDRQDPGHAAADPRVAGVVEQVELEFVAELARLRVTLGQLANLRVGDTIRLDVPVGGTVNLRAEGRVVLRGHPTTNAGQIAIRIAK
ncbi:MAG TPA: FliM/FliN family flagellar motor switch protein [Polyangiaceae bacterium]|nr:FliM/FliN family flagellar motor switch protein [Polyangiaceae bacterium]